MGQVFSYFFNYIFGKSQKSLKDKEDELLYDVYLLMSGGESRFLDEESSNMDIKLSKRDEDHFFNLATAYRRMHDTDDFFENDEYEDLTSEFMARVEKRRNNTNIFY